MNNRNGMGCNTGNTCPEQPCMKKDPLQGMPLGIGYVPIQQWDQTYCPEKALERATIFPCLDLPFCGCVPKSVQNRRGGIS
ncbi:MAG: spore coat associated protein CotJA [Eubacteriales bacterium]|nr:spore coat associated protein CotJA [Eubacteriales bacterium]